MHRRRGPGLPGLHAVDGRRPRGLLVHEDRQRRRSTPSGVYLETGQEIFIGTIDGAAGSFTTTYKFEAKFAPDGAEIHGRCQHPIIEGSGTGAFAGATGRLNFKDIVETGEFVYKGHVDLA